MSEKELRKLISEGLKEGVSAEDQMMDTSEFINSLGIDDEDELPMSAIDMPIQDKGIFSAMEAGENEDDFSDVVSKYGTDGGDYEGNYQDDVSVSPGYFNEDEEVGTDIPLSAIDMPIQDKGIFSAMDSEEVEDEMGDLSKLMNLGGDYEGGFQDDVSVSPGYFNESKNVKITMDELQEIIKEGVAKLHKKTLIENRLTQINNELNGLNDPKMWEEARTEAKSQQKKQNVIWSELAPKARLVSESKAISDDDLFKALKSYRKNK